MTDQQFCLRWNNHQSTLISVFDTLLENGTLVDCTLAAEGQYLKAHKVVLSACSPYLETLLSQHYEKHPIVILKDVKFTELKSMMDYMYRGEVNISQDQLGTFLKAAESLQIKGLSENGEGDARDVGSTQGAKPQAARKTPANAATQQQRPEAAESPANRDGSISPTSRKRRRIRRSSDDDNHLDANSCDLPSQAQSTPIVPNIPASITSTPIKPPIVKPEVNDRIMDHNSLPPESGLLKEKIEPAEPLLEPKTEYLEDLNNDDSVEDLTLDDDDEMDMSQMSNMSNISRPGPSHGADLSNQGFAPWQLGNQSGTDEVFMAAQEAVNAQRDSQAGDDGSSQIPLHHKSTTNIKKRVGVLCSSCGSVTKQGDEIIHKDHCVTNQAAVVCKCQAVFASRRDYLIHRIKCKNPPSKHQGPKAKCKCGRIYSSASKLINHLGKCDQTKGESLEKVVCKCGKKCLSSRGYRTHRKFCQRSPTPEGETSFSTRASSKSSSSWLLDKVERLSDDDEEVEKTETKTPVNPPSIVGSPNISSISFYTNAELSTDQNEDVNLEETLVNEDDMIEATVSNEDGVLEATLVTKSGMIEQGKKMCINKKEKARTIISAVKKSLPDDAPMEDRQDKQALKENPTDDEIEAQTILKNDDVSSSRQNFGASSIFDPVSLPSTSKSVTQNVQDISKTQPNRKSSSKKQKDTKFKCECKKVFTSKTALKVHKRKECQKKSKCQWCPYQTTDKNKMKTHVVKKHSDTILQLLKTT